MRPNSDIRIRIRKIFSNRIIFVFVFGWFFKTEYYSYSYSHDFPNPNSIRIRLKFENRIVCISPKVKIWNFLLCLLAQKTQYAIFTVLSFSICCFLMVFVLIFGIIRIRIRYYSNNLSIRIRIRTKVALRIIFVFVFDQISEPE